MDPKLQALLNRQLTAELETSNLYAAMAAACLRRADLGAAQFFSQKSREELDHRRLVFSYLYSRAADICVGAATAQESKIASCGDIVALGQALLAAEKRTTSLLAECWKCADECGDIRSAVFLEGMLQEQNEEELEAMEIASQAAKFSGCEPFKFDHYLAGKSAAPSQTALADSLGVRMVL